MYVSIEIVNKNCINKKYKLSDYSSIEIPMSHNTFSMQNILNEPLNPDLCKRILQSIKSPLMQQSFAMTNDESFSNSFLNAPKRPDIPPPSWASDQYRRPAVKSKFNTFANGQSFYEESKDYGYNHPNYGTHTEDRNFLETVSNRYHSQLYINKEAEQQGQKHSRIQMESVVSPLDPNITQKKPESTHFINNIFSHLCGDVHNLSYDQNHQVNYNETKYKFHRKKIFNQRALNILKGTDQNKLIQNQVESILLVNSHDQKSHISIQNDSDSKVVEKPVAEVLEELRRNRHVQIASFVGLLTSTIDLLKSAEKERQFLLQNIEMVFQLVSSSNLGFEELIQENRNYNKLLNRMKCCSVTEMIKKISRNKLLPNHNSDFKQFNKQKNKVSDSLETMLESFAQIEHKIEQFLQENDLIHQLKIVYLVLCEKFTKSPTKSTSEQIVNLLRDVRLFRYEKQTYHLEYFWDNFTTSILSETEFINGIVKTNGRYEEEKPQKDETGFEGQLSQMGFVRN